MTTPTTFLERYGPWALVTGTSSGIGAQFAHQLAERGLNLVIVARRDDLNQALAAELRRRHAVEVEPLAVDLAAEHFMQTLMPVCEAKDIGLLVSNAGFGLKGLHHDLDAEQLSAMLNVNCRAPMLLIHRFAPKLIARGRGGILLTGSIEGNVGFPYSAAYASTKAFVRSFGESVWGELKSAGIDVLVLSPGSTDTEAPIKQGFKREDLFGLMSPQEVAKQGLERLPRGPHFIPGSMNRLMMSFIALMPKRWAVPMLGASLKRFIKKT